MINEDKLKSLEKPIHMSKKFMFAIFAILILAMMAVIALLKQPELGWPLAAFMTGIVFVIGFIVVITIGRQADVDKFVRLAAITGQLPSGKIAGKIKSNDEDCETGGDL